MPRWSAAEDSALRSMYRDHTRGQIAAALGRTEGMVRSRCWTLGLNDKSLPWSDAELYALRLAYASAGKGGAVDLPRLAKKLKRDKANVCRKARELGLTNQRRAKAAQLSLVVPRMTKEEISAATSKRMRGWIAEHGHPRGARGTKISPEHRARLNAAIRAAWADPNSKFNAPELAQKKSDRMLARIASGQMRRGGWSRCKAGRRADLGDQYFRSSWEANYARYLNLLKGQGRIAGWDYEIKTFVFEVIKRGTRAYTPDFFVKMNDGSHEWHEVKGWMDQPSRTRLARMAKYYPDEVVRVIGEAWFKQARKSGLAAALRGWE